MASKKTPRTKTASVKGTDATAAPNTATALAEGFVAAERGYALGIQGRKLVCMSPKGQLLASVPKELRDSEVGEQLLAVVDFLVAHEREVSETLERWMLRSLPVPLKVLTELWPDEAYRQALENLIVIPKGGSAGFLRGVDAKKGIGLVDADGETVWSKVSAVHIPHPILLSDLEDLRTLAAELSLEQARKQLFREVFSKPDDLTPEATEVTSFHGGKFEMLTHARGAAKALGYRTSGAFAICRVFEQEKVIEARFWIGADDGYGETYTGELMWVDEAGDLVRITDVTPIAFSEGMRMASAIYGKRVVEKEGDEE